MANVLLYNLSKDKLSKLRVQLLRLGISARVVEKEEFELPIGFLSSPLPPELPEPTEEPFSDELLLMNDFSRQQLNELLDSLRRSRISIPLKAIVTPTNASWSSFRLHRELCAERDAIESGQRAHS